MNPMSRSSSASTPSTAAPAQPPPADDGVTWGWKMLARGCGTVGGLVALSFGLFVCLTFHALCLASGLLQMLMGFLVVTLEAPCCCIFLDFIQQITKFSESRPYWQKAMLYCFISPIPVVLCFEASTFFGVALIFITGMLYGMMALGKKADRETMIARMTGQQPPQDNMNINLVDREKQPNFFAA